MSGYVPATSLIKEGYVSCALTAKGEDSRAVWFDRWLAVVKADVYDEALQDAGVSPMPRNPYREETE